ncbi:Uncharacterised protein [Salmonella bongori]|nr:Uncharacterised protein [Salmonella bongori]
MVGELTLLALSVAVTVNLFAVGLCGDERKGKVTFAIRFAATERRAFRRGDRDGAARFGGAADTGAILTNYHVFRHFRRGTVRRDDRCGGAFVFRDIGSGSDKRLAVSLRGI